MNNIADDKMSFTKTLHVTAVLLICLNAKTAATDIQNCDFPCDESDRKAVCAFDKDEVCFRFLPSKCDMDLMNCIFQLNYKIYMDEFCEIDAFKCKDEPIVQSPPANKVSSAENFSNSLESVENHHEPV